MGRAAVVVTMPFKVRPPGARPRAPAGSRWSVAAGAREGARTPGSGRFASASERNPIAPGTRLADLVAVEVHEVVMHPLVHDNESAPRQPLAATRTLRGRFLLCAERITRGVYPDRVHKVPPCGPGPGVFQHLRGHLRCVSIIPHCI